jgi:hypothetical protein
MVPVDPTLIGGSPEATWTLQEFAWARFSWDGVTPGYRAERASASHPGQVLLYTPTGRSDIDQLVLRAGSPVLLQGDLLAGLVPLLSPGPTVSTERPAQAVPLTLKDDPSDDILRGITFRIRETNEDKTVVDLECLYVEAHTDPVTGL